MADKHLGPECHAACHEKAGAAALAGFERHLRAGYATPVFCTVYQLRRNGQRLSPAEVKLTEVKGYLRYGPRGGTPVVDCRLSDEEGTEFLVLEHATLLKIEKGGILFRGLERIGYNEHVRQGWWCVPETQKAPDAEAPGD